MDKEHQAIERLKEAALMSERIYKKPLIVTTSGGKDSSVCVELAQRAGIDFEVEHNHTTADAPETVYFVRKEFKRLENKEITCRINYPVYKGKRTSMWDLILQKQIPPTRLVRYCCSILKEGGGKGRFITTGVRWSESLKRKEKRGIFENNTSNISKRVILKNDNDDKRMLFESCNIKAMRICNPIIDWTDDDVWGFLNAEKVPVNPVYCEGFKRVGCIGCPLAGKSRYKEFARWPAYENMYIRTFDRMIKARIEAGKIDGTWRMGTTGKDVFHWWMEDGVLPGQIGFEDLLEDEE